MRSGLCAMAALVLACLGGATSPASPQAPACAKSDFEAVVKEAGTALSGLNQQNAPLFQAKLRQLKDKRNWTNNQFLKEAEPFVRDDTIAGYDKKSEELVGRITGGGGQGEAAAPDCALLDGLRTDLKLLVETQQAKWTHMFAKIDEELAK
jgi:hypothetical protein